MKKETLERAAKIVERINMIKAFLGADHRACSHELHIQIASRLSSSCDSFKYMALSIDFNAVRPIIEAERDRLEKELEGL